MRDGEVKVGQNETPADTFVSVEHDQQRSRQVVVFKTSSHQPGWLVGWFPVSSSNTCTHTHVNGMKSFKRTANSPRTALTP